MGFCRADTGLATSFQVKLSISIELLHSQTLEVLIWSTQGICYVLIAIGELCKVSMRASRKQYKLPGASEMLNLPGAVCIPVLVRCKWFTVWSFLY
jgi:hypothetical protein